jgi:SNF2 family DNA or RNA helicase
LDLVGSALDDVGIKYTRIDGSMTTEARTKALDDLNHDDDTRVILLSLKAAGVGINCTRANHIHMLDPWWNASIENQAIDRVHRLGQTRPVHVFRYTMAGTIEERMLKVQEAKATLGKGTMTKLSAAEEKIAKVTSLKDLFEIKDCDDDEMRDFIDKTDDWY